MEITMRKLSAMLLAIGLFAGCRQHTAERRWINKARVFWIDLEGNDDHSGLYDSPWKTIDRLNREKLLPGDTVYFKGGQLFKGTIMLDSSDTGEKDRDVVISSDGETQAIIESGDVPAIIISGSGFIHISNLHLKGSGRKEGNRSNGASILNSRHIRIEGLDISGFQKSGLLTYCSSFIEIRKVYAHDNGYSGIYASGNTSKKDCHDIYIGYCKAENNPGDPTNLDNHSGNGILAGFCSKVMIEYCVATGNGWDMPRKGNGPVGIWAFESDSVTIQRCISYRNKSSSGGADGGGFDLDGGMTNSIVQYCLSYENQGSGYGIFQYEGASRWHNNIFRYNISENDGDSLVGAGILVWNSSLDPGQFSGCYFYNNTIYNKKGAALRYDPSSEHRSFRFYNNIFVGKAEIIRGDPSVSEFAGNNWWSLENKFLAGDAHSLDSWASMPSRERYNGRLSGLNLAPAFKNSGGSSDTDPMALPLYENYLISHNGRLWENGIDLKKEFDMSAGDLNFNGRPIHPSAIGASY